MKLKYKQADVQFKRFKSKPEKLRFPEIGKTSGELAICNW